MRLTDEQRYTVTVPLAFLGNHTKNHSWRYRVWCALKCSHLTPPPGEQNVTSACDSWKQWWETNFEWLYQENLLLLHKLPYVLLCLYTIAIIMIIITTIIESSEKKNILARLQFLAGLGSESPFGALFSQWGGSLHPSPLLISGLLWLPVCLSPVCASTNVHGDG